MPSEKPRGCYVLFLIFIVFGCPGASADQSSYRFGDCGVSISCDVDGGRYFLALPEDWNGQSELPVVLYFHGWQGTGAAAMSNSSLVDGFTDRGWAFVAADGLNKTWAHQGSPAHRFPDARDEITYIEAVLADLASRLPIASTLAAGFSQGGSMVWDVACRAPDLFDGFAPIAGAFWEPLPEECVQSPRLVRHIHGTSDTVVPMEGRPIGDRWHQGDLGESLDLVRAAGSCGGEAEFVRAREDGLSCRRWFSCDDGGSLDICLHEGGHIRPHNWIPSTIGWMEDQAAR